tara:strand:+ start:319 stop:492 length:174 start_codon:yes stop_codon:yes gene_type:complete
MEKPNRDNFFETYLDIDHWAESEEIKDSSIKNTSKKRIRQEKRKIESNSKWKTKKKK